MSKNYRAELVGCFGNPIDENPTGVVEEAAFLETECDALQDPGRAEGFFEIVDLKKGHGALAFHGAGHQAAHEVTSGDDVDDKGGTGRQDRAGEVDIVFLHARRGIDQIVQRHRDGDGIDA